MSADRRATFRQFVSRLDISADPATAIEQGLYVAPPGAISDRLATRLELEPTSTHMLVGGIGSGKTTQLLQLRDRLNALGDVRAFFVDATERQGGEHLTDLGLLLALAGLEIRTVFEESRAGQGDSEAHEAALETIKRLALGYLDPFYGYDVGDDPSWVPGVIKPPETPYYLERLVEGVETLTSALSFKPVMLIDGLDRVGDMSRFAQLVTHDVPMLRRAGVGLVVVAPQYARTWQHGSIGAYFDELHLHGAAHIGSEQGVQFLENVLSARTPESGLLRDDARVTLARRSGGIIRDLLALSRSAAEEAYRSGADAVTTKHVGTAAGHFGRSLLVGIDSDMSVRLTELTRNIRRDGFLDSFTVATETDVMLLLRRLVIEVATTPVRYMLHPTIHPHFPRRRGAV